MTLANIIKINALAVLHCLADAPAWPILQRERVLGRVRKVSSSPIRDTVYSAL